MQSVLKGPSGTEDPAIRRACDQCRLRKIRCDKDWPCANCRIANRSCTSTGAGQRPKEPRQRVLISSQYERKIDLIEARLGNIESLLRDISKRAPSSSSGGIERGASNHDPHSAGNDSLNAANSVNYFTSSSTAVNNTPSLAPTTTAASTTAASDSSDSESEYGGDTGLAAQTAFASEFLERAVKRTSLRDSNPKMEAALANLGQLVDLQRTRSISHGPRFPLQKPVPQGGLSKLPMPPMEPVIGMLKRLKSPNSPPSLFSFLCSIVGINDFNAMCRAIYFPTEDFSDATFTIVNAGLYNLFMEWSTVITDEEKRAEYQGYGDMCRANLETCLINMPLFQSTKVDNVQALLLGAMYAVDVCRPSVAWHLNAAAAQLCQTGGYHRIEHIRNEAPDVAQVKTILFWQIYTLDKVLCLRLGRSTAIHDCDISISRSFNFEGILHMESTTIPSLWAKIAMLQGQVYEQLYSPAALAGRQSDLIQRAQALGAECRALEGEGAAAREQAFSYLKSLNSSELVDIFIKGDEVQFQVTLTLIYRAIPAREGSVSRFCDECLEAARKAMKAHQTCLESVDLGGYLSGLYVHWNLMLTPYAPFFVLFCYVIETSSLQDLKILQEFVDSLEPACQASEAAEKLYRLCRLMYDVASMYVEARSQQEQDVNMVPIGDEFELYLSQLGFMPGEDQAGLQQTVAGAADVGGEGAGQTAQIADWFSGSRNMIGLLEEDLSHIDAYRMM